MIAIQIPKTQYSTISYARLMSVDMPFASHNRGVPFNEKNGPAIAIGAAAMSISGGMAIIGTSALLGGLMIAGGVMSGLGALTGNKTLSTLGMVASLAGGIGYGLSNSMTGEFMNPFSEGFKFADTNAGEMFKGIKNVFSTPSAADTMGIGGDSLVNGAAGQGADLAVEGGNAWNPLSSDTAGMTHIDGVAQTVGGKVSDAVSSVGSSLTSGSSGGGSNGLLGSILGNKDMMSFIGGAADNYQNQPLVDAQVNRLEQVNANDKFALDAAKQKQANMLAQPTVNIGVNPNANLFNGQPQNQGNKYAVVMNGEVKYLSQAEYDAVKQAQGGSGLLPQGATA